MREICKRRGIRFVKISANEFNKETYTGKYMGTAIYIPKGGRRNRQRIMPVIFQEWYPWCKCVYEVWGFFGLQAYYCFANYREFLEWEATHW